MKNKNYKPRSIYLWRSTVLVLLLLSLSCKDKTADPKSADVRHPIDENGFISLFNGTSLEGWEGDNHLWRIENGPLIGELIVDRPLESNSFLIWEGGNLRDFELKLEFRITESGNSGINYRSEQLDSVTLALK